MLNKFTLQGRLTKDTELKKTKDGKSVCNFSIAWNYGEKKKLFQDCVAYGNVAETINKYFVKGQQIIVSGSLFTQEWKSQSGDTRKQNKLNVIEVHFCGPTYPQEENEVSDEEFKEIEDEALQNLPW